MKDAFESIGEAHSFPLFGRNDEKSNGESLVLVLDYTGVLENTYRKIVSNEMSFDATI